MTIGDYIKLTDIETYKRLMRLSRIEKPPKRIKLGDKPENLMKHDSYKRIKGKLTQRGWG